MSEIDVIIAKCLGVRGQKPGKMVPFEEKELLWLCKTARQVLLEQPNLLELEAPIKIVGDIHGNRRN
jgi:serine/threonine-protein phosphatase PP1 catalytic subunit